jgi:hypothetical protein
MGVILSQGTEGLNGDTECVQITSVCTEPPTFPSRLQASSLELRKVGHHSHFLAEETEA